MPRETIRAKGHDKDRSLGWLAVEWMEWFCVHGPGDVQGDPVRVTDEFHAFIVDCYAVDARGRLLYDSAFLSRPKGCDKSGLAARFCMFEALGPCRFAGWADGGEVYEDPWGLGFRYVYPAGEPMGRPVRSPFIRCMATEEGQTGNTYDSIHVNFTEGPLAGVPGIDPGLTRTYLPGGGEITPSTASSSAKDGGKETFVVFDEALALDTVLPTPVGWAKMGDVQVGDYLIGADGQPVLVVKATDEMVGRDCYRVTFEDGSTMVASAGHLWQTKVCRSAALPKVRTTEEMVEDGRRFRVPAGRPWNLAAVDLPLDPYVLGLWLGDGDSRNATITVGDEDVVETERIIQEAGFTTKRVRNSRPKTAPLLYVSVPGSTSNRFSKVKGLLVRLRELGVLGAKHVPAQYLRASFDQRLALLQGLMDSDGSVSPSGSCCFVQNRAVIADAVVELLRSFGQSVTKTWRPDPRSRVGGSWFVGFTPKGIVPFRLPRKVARVRGHQRGAGWVTIRCIEPVDSVPVKCIAVDSEDHLFLAGEGCQVTHNTHVYDRPELRNMYKVVGRNMRKRKKIAGTWFLETTTMFSSGADSVAEQTYDLAGLIREGKTKRERLLFDHRWGDCEDLSDEPALRAGLVEAYGDALEWNDLDGLVDDFFDPRNSPSDSRRYFLNAPGAAADAWMAHPEWSACADAMKVVADRDVITLGFDGSRKRARGFTDATALVACRVEDGHVFEPLANCVWEQPDGPAGSDWQVPTAEVLAAVDEVFRRYTVVGFYADPPLWEGHIAGWEAKYGSRLKVKATRDHPIEWWTNRQTAMVRAVQQFEAAVLDGELTHHGYTLTRHVLAAHRRVGRAGVSIGKESAESPRKVDAAMAAILAWQARLDAVAAGVGARSGFVPVRVR